MLIFDMDGTLIDSNGIWRDVDTAFLAKRGLPYTREYYEGVAHTVFPKAAIFTKEYCHLSESTDEIMAEWMEMAGDLYTSVPTHCHAALGHLGLKPYFEHIYFAQELGMDKKEPAIYRKTAELLGVDVADCTIFDDSIAACRSARTAGMQVIGVYDEFFHVSWDEMQTVCHRCIRSFAELV